MLNNARVPVLGFAAHSGAGKTTLLIGVLRIFKERGYRVGVVKHAHHSFEIDKPGKDSYELRKAGARQMLISSRQRWALVTETDGTTEPRLDDLLHRLDQSALDFILVEGFKAETYPKIEVHRPSLGHPLLHPHDSAFVALATDALPTAMDGGSAENAGAVFPPTAATRLPVLDLNRPEDIADFILNYLLRSPARRTVGVETRSRS